MDAKPSNREIDSGLLSLVVVARLHNVPAEAGQIRHEFGSDGRSFAAADVVRAAKWLGLKARAVSADRRFLHTVHCPCIARYADGRFVVVGGVTEAEVLVKDPAADSPQTVSQDVFETVWSGQLILIARRSSGSGGPGEFNFSWFVPFILKYRKYLGDVVVASFFIQMFALITPLFFQIVVDKVLVHRGLTTLDILAFGLFIVSAFEVVLTGLRNYVFAHTTNRIDVALGSELFRHLLRLPVGYFKARRIGDIVARIRELETIRGFITGSSLTLVVDVFFTIVFFSVLYLYSPVLTLIVMASLPCYVALAVCITPSLRSRLREKFERGADNHAFLVESITGVETLKASALEPLTHARWEERLAAYVSASFRATRLSNIAAQTAALINKLVVLAILWLGARRVIDGELSVGQLVAFNMIAGRISGPILRLVQLWQDFQQAGISLSRLGDILDAQTEPGRALSRGSLPRLDGRVRFDHVTFRYHPGGPEVLHDISLDVAAGEVIGIVGRSGSGKSTLGRLVQRLYVPESGRVLVDGVDLAMVDPTWLRRRTGAVLQENMLFNCSVRENIAIADPALSLDRVIRAAKLAGAHDFIVTLADGYDTVVGESGSRLSGGQRQRLAIARALVTEPGILILDEATSALDDESERIIHRNMRAICDGRTVFVIAHRLSSVRVADRIIVLDSGRIVETGAHHELLARGGPYAVLFQRQVGMSA